MRNNYEIRGEVTAIFIYRPKYGYMETLISTSKLEKVMQLTGSWYPFWSRVKNRFYVYGTIYHGDGTKSSIILHRLLTNAPRGMVVDHIDHDTLNNTDSNLRCVSSSANSQNRKGARSGSSSGIRGVYWDDQKKKWTARCTINGKLIRLGRYKTIEEAEHAAIEGRKKYLPFSSEAN